VVATEGQRGLTAPHLALQIHDELVIELPEQDLARVQAIVKQEMEHAVALDVPMVVNLFAGQRWGSLEPL
jgi:DNA polymerase-1